MPKTPRKLISTSRDVRIALYGEILSRCEQLSFLSDEIYPDLLMLIGVIGFYCAMKLLMGVKKNSKKHLEWWIVYQLVVIIHQAYVYVVTLNIFETSLDMQRFVKLIAVVAIVHIAHEFGFLVVVMKLHISFNNLRNNPADNNQADGQRNERGDQQVLTGRADKPPSYEQVVSTAL